MSTAVDVRELRTQLQTARNDVMRYASRVHRLEQQLATLQAATEAATTISMDNQRCAAVTTDDVVASATLASDAWLKVIRDAAAEQPRNHRSDDTCDAQTCNSAHAVETSVKLDELQRFLAQQTQVLATLGRENAKLRDQLATRPTRSELVTAELALEHHRKQLRALRTKQTLKSASTAQPHSKDTPVAATSASPVCEPLAGDTLAERIHVDKLLRALRVETVATRAATSDSKHNRSMYRTFVRDPSLRCYVVLDPAALEAMETEADSQVAFSAASTTSSSGVPAAADVKKQQQRVVLERRVGSLCSEIVAACCYELHIARVGDLLQTVRDANRRASLVPVFQRVVRKLQTTMSRLQDSNNKSHAAFVLPSGSTSSTRRPREGLEHLLERLDDVASELLARRQQMAMARGASSAFDTLFALMALLRAKSMDELQSTVLRLLESGRREKLFVQQLRELVGLDATATRNDIARTVAAFMQQLGLPAGHRPTITA